MSVRVVEYHYGVSPVTGHPALVYVLRLCDRHFAKVLNDDRRVILRVWQPDDRIACQVCRSYRRPGRPA